MSHAGEAKSRPSSRGAPQYLPDVTYDHEPVAVPDDHAHSSANQIGETPAAPLTRQLTRRITHGKDALRKTEAEETDEDRAIIRRKSIAVAQLAVFKVDKDGKGNEKEVRTRPPGPFLQFPPHPPPTSSPSPFLRAFFSYPPPSASPPADAHLAKPLPCSWAT